jgi:hypothetical protein
LVKVTVIGALVVPTAWVPKDTGEGASVISVPFPVNGMTCGLPQALSTMVIMALRFPRADGVKVTVIEHVAPTASVAPQLLDVIRKSLLLVPPFVMLVMASAVWPEFFNVSVRAELVVLRS